MCGQAARNALYTQGYPSADCAGMRPLLPRPRRLCGRPATGRLGCFGAGFRHAAHCNWVGQCRYLSWSVKVDDSSEGCRIGPQTRSKKIKIPETSGIDVSYPHVGVCRSFRNVFHGASCLRTETTVLFYVIQFCKPPCEAGVRMPWRVHVHR